MRAQYQSGDQLDRVCVCESGHGGVQGCVVAEWRVFLGMMFFGCFEKYRNGRYFEVLWLKVCILLDDGNLI